MVGYGSDGLSNQVLHFGLLFGEHNNLAQAKDPTYSNGRHPWATNELYFLLYLVQTTPCEMDNATFPPCEMDNATPSPSGMDNAIFSLSGMDTAIPSPCRMDTLHVEWTMPLPFHAE